MIVCLAASHTFLLFLPCFHGIPCPFSIFHLRYLFRRRHGILLEAFIGHFQHTQYPWQTAFVVSSFHRLSYQYTMRIYYDHGAWPRTSGDVNVHLPRHDCISGWMDMSRINNDIASSIFGVLLSSRQLNLFNMLSILSLIMLAFGLS